jgi:hypothetical protein
MSIKGFRIKNCYELSGLRRLLGQFIIDTGIIMDIPTKLELVWKPKLITRLIENGWIYVSGICIWEYETLKIKDR